jgi:calcineurin-like phosphoesterase family protein
MIYYTSDLHLGHANIIKLCGRPFANVEEMNDCLVKNWNGVVTKDDTVYILGDFAFRSAVSVKPVIKILNGAKHLVLGNHDAGWIKNLNPGEYFASVSSLKEIEDGDTRITLCHYPMLSWNRAAYGAVLVHGHIHNSTDAQTFGVLKNMNAYNAGVEVNGYKPATLEQLKANKEKFYALHPIAE